MSPTGVASQAAPVVFSYPRRLQEKGYLKKPQNAYLSFEMHLPVGSPVLNLPPPSAEETQVRKGK